MSEYQKHFIELYNGGMGAWSEYRKRFIELYNGGRGHGVSTGSASSSCIMEVGGIERVPETFHRSV